MVLFNDFASASFRADRPDEVALARVAPVAGCNKNVTRESWFDFHKAHVAEHKDNSVIYSLCLPVYAVPLRKDLTLEDAAVKCRVHREKELAKVRKGTGIKHERDDDETNLLLEGQAVSSLCAISAYNPSSSRKRKASPPEVIVNEKYTTRSGRKTKVLFTGDDDDRSSVDSDAVVEGFGGGDDDDLSVGGTSKRKSTTKRKRMSFGNRPRPPRASTKSEHAALCRHYDLEETIPIKREKSDMPSMALVLKDGLVVSVTKPDKPEGPGPFKGAYRVRVGDRVELGDGSELDSASTIVIKRSLSRDIKKINGLFGDPIVPVDLFRVVEKHGGFEKVVYDRLWQTIRVELGLKQTTSCSFALRKAYESYFLK